MFVDVKFIHSKIIARGGTNVAKKKLQPNQIFSPEIKQYALKAQQKVV
jgi:hypothetical protein